MRVAHLDYANTARGPTAPLAALRKAYPHAGHWRERGSDAQTRVYDRIEKGRTVASYRVQVVPGTRGGWLLTEASYAGPCGAGR
jgi:hypothetical protein